MTLFFAFSRYGAQGLTLSKILPHICNLLGDPVSQVCLMFHLIINLQLTDGIRGQILYMQMFKKHCNKLGFRSILIFGSSFRNRDTCSAHSAMNAMQNMNQFLCFQVRDRAVSSLVEIYRHVGERVRLDLSKKGIPQPRYAKSTQPAYCYLFTNVCQLPLLSYFCTFSHPEQTVFVGGVI